MSEVKSYSGTLFNISGWLTKENIIDYLDSFKDNYYEHVSYVNFEYEKGKLESFFSDNFMIIHRDDNDMYALFSIDKKEEDPEFNCIITSANLYDNEYKFLTTYYNGGTYLQEMIQDEFNNIFK